MPGIATGSILALSRAIGESAPLIMIGAITFVSFDPTILGPFSALPVQIYNWTKQPQEEFKLLAEKGYTMFNWTGPSVLFLRKGTGK